MRFCRICTILILFIFIKNEDSLAQPFINDIKNFSTLDSISKPVINPILFIGSSSFTNWKNIQHYFPTYPIINRGFGGSCLPHLILYADNIIFKYQPKQIIIYCGENDIATEKNTNADSVFSRFEKLFLQIRKKLPHVAIAYISIKPSPSRIQYIPEFMLANRLIKEFLSTQKNTVFINVFDAMFTQDKQINPAIFIEDSLHLNSVGYKLWQEQIEPHLLK